MRNVLVAAVAFVAVVFTAATVAAAAPNGTLLESRPYAWPRYGELGPLAKVTIPPDAFAKLTADSSIEMARLIYASDGLREVAYLCRPRNATAQAKKPLLLWLHGGAGENAKIGAANFETLWQMRRFAAAGFVVLAPQYRGIDGGEGKEDVGGNDLDDVAALIPLGRALGYADGSRVFVWGLSRGAQIAVQLIRARAPITAAVAVGLPPELSETLERAPDFARLLPAEAKSEAGLARRSPMRWANEVTGVPILLLHGGDDQAVPVASLLAFASKLAAAGGNFEVHVYAREDHTLMRRADEVFQRSLDWFGNVRRPSVASLLGRALRRGESAQAAAQQVRSLKKREPDRWDFAERDLNFLGYSLLIQGRAPDAVVVFELNSELHATSANVWDSLAEGFAAVGRRQDAVRAYRRSLALDGKNDNARRALETLGAAQK
jgi:acetyl esterase/lipase